MRSFSNYPFLTHGRDFSNPPTLENTSPLRYLPLRPLPPSGISNAFCGGILTYSGTTQCFINFWGLKGKL